LADVLDHSLSDELILVTSFGSGAGSDAFIIKTTKENETRRNKKTVRKCIEYKKYLDYALYAKFKGKIKGVSLQK